MPGTDYQHGIKKVAIIGSGPSGTPAARHLREAGLEVRVFERQSMPGGVWNWRPEVSKPLSVPTPPPSRGAFTPINVTGESETVYRDVDSRVREAFCPANPVYASLSNNVPTATMAFKDFPFPPGTQPNIRHDEIARYVHAYAHHFCLLDLTSFNTRVEKVEKVGKRWRLSLWNVETIDAKEDIVKERTYIEDFDAVVVATGHYTAPYIPDIPGAAVWAETWPDRVIHSQGYRKPEPYSNGNILIVGTGTSGIDIAWDLRAYAQKIFLIGKDEIQGPEQYQRQRKLQRHLLPPNGVQLGEILSFHAPANGRMKDTIIELKSGERLTNISCVIFASGYQYSFPFLDQYHHDPQNGISQETLVTDGDGVHNLYRDVFYISDPTLAFLGLSINTSAFSFFEYQSLAIARVFSGKARLPNDTEQRKLYETALREKGGGKFIHLLGKDGERQYVRETVEWLNRDGANSGAARIEGHSEEWLKSSDTILQSIVAKYGVDIAAVFPGQGKSELKDQERDNRKLPSPVSNDLSRHPNRFVSISV